MNTLKIYLTFFLFCLSIAVFSQQDRFTELETKLKELAKTDTALMNPVYISVNNSSIQDFVRGIAKSNNLNVSVDPSIDAKITNNFSDVPAIDVFIFLCKKYELDITFTGKIITFTKYVIPIITPDFNKSQKVQYNSFNDLLSIDASNDSLLALAKIITRISKKNVVVAPDLAGKMVTGFVQNTTFQNTLEKFGFANDLRITKTDDDFYLIEKKEKTNPNDKNPTGYSQQKYNMPIGVVIKTKGDTLVSLSCSSAPISEIIGLVSNEMKRQYYVFSDLKGNISLNVNDLTYDEFLKNILNGTEFTFKKQQDLYLLGDRNLEGLRTSKVYQLKFRTVDKVLELIPADLKKGVDIKTFMELNALILSGSQPLIDEIELFLRAVDRIVPNVAIEVMIVDVNDSKTFAGGITAGLGTAPKTTAGDLLPGINFNLGAGAINNIIAGINGIGNVNLGAVTPNFYVNIQAMESRGILKLRSTPQIATLNGTKAKLSIGRTEYYLELTNSIVGVQNPLPVQSQTYKSVNADLSVSINPIVSGDEQITLEINVKQSSFTARINPNAPPGTITRDFNSFIRVKNGEMILLGGLEEDQMNETGKGLPFLSRVPILKWIFGSRSRVKSKSKLTIFIRPMVVY